MGWGVETDVRVVGANRSSVGCLEVDSMLAAAHNQDNALGAVGYRLKPRIGRSARELTATAILAAGAARVVCQQGEGMSERR